jgi:hypothetical protein
MIKCLQFLVQKQKSIHTLLVCPCQIHRIININPGNLRLIGPFGSFYIKYQTIFHYHENHLFFYRFIIPPINQAPGTRS